VQGLSREGLPPLSIVPLPRCYPASQTHLPFGGRPPPLEGCSGSSLIGTMQVLGHRLDALRCLRLVDVTNLTDDGLMGMLSGPRMTALEELSLSGCLKVRGAVLAQVCSRFPSLKVLLPAAARPRPLAGA
jgi:hypothetical protein